MKVAHAAAEAYVERYSRIKKKKHKVYTSRQRAYRYDVLTGSCICRFSITTKRFATLVPAATIIHAVFFPWYTHWHFVFCRSRHIRASRLMVIPDSRELIHRRTIPEPHYIIAFDAASVARAGSFIGFSHGLTRKKRSRAQTHTRANTPSHYITLFSWFFFFRIRRERYVCNIGHLAT